MKHPNIYTKWFKSPETFKISLTRYLLIVEDRNLYLHFQDNFKFILGYKNNS